MVVHEPIDVVREVRAEPDPFVEIGDDGLVALPELAHEVRCRFLHAVDALAHAGGRVEEQEQGHRSDFRREELELLRSAVLVDEKVIGIEVRDESALLVGDDHAQVDSLDGGSKLEAVLLTRILARMKTMGTTSVTAKKPNKA